MKGLVDGQCGQANALVGLSHNLAQNNARLQTGVDAQIRGAMPAMARGDQFADEFLNRLSAQTAAPSTMNMKAMTRALPDYSQRSSSASDLSRAWASEFQPRTSAFSAGPMASQWTRQYLQQQPPSLSQSSVSSVSTAQTELDGIWRQAQQKAETQMWSGEYLQQFDAASVSSATAAASSRAAGWADEFLTQTASAAPPAAAPTEQMAKDFQSEWDSLQNAELTDDFMQMNSANEYLFQSENPFMTESDLAAKGSEMLRNGNIAEAVQCFEAAVQQNPQDANAWCQLGLSLAENEHDGRAIAAFRKALEIEPSNREALLACAVSLANESMEIEALNQLEKWISAYTRPHEPVPAKTLTSPMSTYALLEPQRFHEVEQLFLSAARQQQPHNVDPDLQNALGVLYNINRNYERAIDSLQTALAVRPEDARLWNRLGATLANGDRTPEAISAYRQALTLFPTFVRARYNLGISCMHLKSYRDAVDHFLSALQIQKSPANSPIWSTMRSAALRMTPSPSNELMEALDSRDVVRFTEALGRMSHPMTL